MPCLRCHGHKASSFALTLGAALGAAFGLLFAQRPGKELRSALARAKKRGVKSAASVLGKELKGVGKDVAAVSRDGYESDPVQSAVEAGITAVEHAKERGQELLGRTEEAVENSIEKVKDAAKRLRK